jgi:hypothetical protein
MEIQPLKYLLLNSYKDKDKQDAQINGLIRDDSLSGKRTQVYVNPLTNEATVSHRGTSGIHDVFTDAALSVGLLKNTKRYKHANKIQKQAEKKYDVTNTIGHRTSLGAGIAGEVGKKSQITTLNKPVGVHNVNKKRVKKNQKILKLHVVILLVYLDHFRKVKKQPRAVIKSKTWNPSNP